jgi:RNA polymerase sigma-70 factor (ECF subfamily)
MRKGRAGEPFDRVFRSRYAEIVRLCTRILGDHTEAEDAAQEAFGRLADHEMLAQPDEEIAAWLRRVAMNASFNRLRTRRRRHDRERRSHALPPTADTDQPLSAALIREEQQAVREILAELPERQRTCLLLRHSGYSYREIAATTGLAVGSVGVVLARAERAFRTHYEGANHEHVS